MSEAIGNFLEGAMSSRTQDDFPSHLGFHDELVCQKSISVNSKKPTMELIDRFSALLRRHPHTVELIKPVGSGISEDAAPLKFSQDFPSNDRVMDESEMRRREAEQADADSKQRETAKLRTDCFLERSHFESRSDLPEGDRPGSHPRR